MNHYVWMDIIETSWFSESDAKKLSDEINSSKDYIQKNFGGHLTKVNGRISLRQQSMDRVSDMEPWFRRFYHDTAMDNGVENISSNDRVAHSCIDIPALKIMSAMQREIYMPVDNTKYMVVYDTIREIEPIPTELIKNLKEGDTLDIKLREYIQYIFNVNDPENASVVYSANCAKFKLYDTLDCRLVAKQRGRYNYGNLSYPLQIPGDLTFEETFKIIGGYSND